MHKIFLGIGSNLGDRAKNLREAVTCIEREIGKVVKTSSVFETEPWGFETDSFFFNMVIEVESKLNPSDLLNTILGIEEKLGRIRSGKQYSSRIIDIDILLFDDLLIDELNLKIPHPHMHERRFVLIPLNEICPELVHPVLKRNIGSLLSSCEDGNDVKLIGDLPNDYDPHDS